MTISNFSAILNFAIKQQEEAIIFFKASQNTAQKELFLMLCGESEKNLKNLKTILRENIAEIVMEPCEELNESNYLLAEGADSLQSAVNILEKQKEFLLDASRVVNLKDVKRILEKMSVKIGSLILEIQK